MLPQVLAASALVYAALEIYHILQQETQTLRKRNEIENQPKKEEEPPDQRIQLFFEQPIPFREIVTPRRMYQRPDFLFERACQGKKLTDNEGRTAKYLKQLDALQDLKRRQEIFYRERREREEKRKRQIQQKGKPLFNDEWRNEDKGILTKTTEKGSVESKGKQSAESKSSNQNEPLPPEQKTSENQSKLKLIEVPMQKSIKSQDENKPLEKTINQPGPKKTNEAQNTTGKATKENPISSISSYEALAEKTQDRKPPIHPHTQQQPASLNFSVTANKPGSLFGDLTKPVIITEQKTESKPNSALFDSTPKAGSLFGDSAKTLDTKPKQDKKQEEAKKTEEAKPSLFQQATSQPTKIPPPTSGLFGNTNSTLLGSSLGQSSLFGVTSTPNAGSLFDNKAPTTTVSATAATAAPTPTTIIPTNTNPTTTTATPPATSAQQMIQGNKSLFGGLLPDLSKSADASSSIFASIFKQDGPKSTRLFQNPSESKTLFSQPSQDSSLFNNK